MKRNWMKQVSIMVISSFVLAILPQLTLAEETVGKLHGFVYGNDGKKPLADAVVLIRETVSQRIFQSEKSKKSGAYLIENILPGTYIVGIQYNGKEYNVDVLLKIEPKKQMACFTLPKVEEKPGYLIHCKSPKCFFITPCGWALVAGVTAGITYGIIKITETAVSPTGI
jgi:hypothetical protein